jgi:hypothetical protein
MMPHIISYPPSFDKFFAEGYRSSWGDNGNNYTFVVSASCDVTVSFDSTSKTASVTGNHGGKETGLEVFFRHAVGNGSVVGIYSDDDGYYGESTLTNLAAVTPYDLVVYKAGSPG